MSSCQFVLRMFLKYIIIYYKIIELYNATFKNFNNGYHKLPYDKPLILIINLKSLPSVICCFNLVRDLEIL